MCHYSVILLYCLFVLWYNSTTIVLGALITGLETLIKALCKYPKVEPKMIPTPRNVEV